MGITKLDPTHQIQHIRPEELDEDTDPATQALAVSSLTDEVNAIKAQLKRLSGPGALHWYSPPSNTSQFNAQADESVNPGNVVYMKPTGRISRSKSGGTLQEAKAVGLSFTTTASGFGATVITEGLFELEDWTAVIGTKFLNPGDIIFVGTTGGLLTTSAPSAGYRTFIGEALTDKLLKLAIELPIGF